MTEGESINQLFNCLKCRDKNWLIKCAHCEKIIFRRDSNGRLRRFEHGHNNNNKKKHDTYKRHNIRGYWMLYIPSYFNSDKNDRILEHVYNYQEFHKLCMLRWGNVHHIIPVKDGGSNLPYNLQGMMEKNHHRIHKTGNTYKSDYLKKQLLKK